MTQKLKLLMEVYRLQNLLSALKGEKEVDIDELTKTYKFQQLLKESKVYELEEKVLSLNNSYIQALDTKQIEKQTAAYYATPEGEECKKRLEQLIRQTEDDWNQIIRKNISHIDEIIRRKLGSQWGVLGYNEGYLNIGVINADESTPERRNPYFGQDICIYYKKDNYPPYMECLRSNCGTTGDFSMEGGQTVGERAMFYVGLGLLYSDAALINDIKSTMANGVVVIDRLREEYKVLRATLADPLKIGKKLKAERHSQSVQAKRKPKHGRGI